MTSSRDDLPAGVPCWIDIELPDPDAAAIFYAGLFGWDLEEVMPDAAPGSYKMARLEGKLVAALGSQQAGFDGPAAWMTYVRTDDADATAAAVAAAGGTVLAGPMDIFEAGRMVAFADPQGAVLGAWQPGGTIGVEQVNEPGAWNFSDLVAGDVAAAERFYGAVFGWERSPFDASQPGGPGYWRKPGYGDWLERLNPGTRERNAAMGAPDRFEDAVATVAPAEAGATAHWGITFGTADADRSAELARELGGTVLAEPFDAPWVRMTVVADPAGAVLTVSRFVPPEA